MIWILYLLKFQTYFWYGRWLGEIPLCTLFRRLFGLSVNKLCSVATMYDLVGRRGERRGASGGACGCGRRSCLQSVEFHFPLLFCSLMFWISGSGSLILKGVTQCIQAIGFSLLRKSFMRIPHMILFGMLRFHRRWLSLLGDCYVIGYQLNLTWCTVVSLRLRLPYVRRCVARPKQQLICSYIAPLLVRCGS